ncbi:hypothetical protein NQ318_015536 [Aromia moschata]|uniref:Uncharacterized protein n=1 Tax=Aromia moschata TaxID=1265417 RepID=A0AAV8YA61_9CUCU|nr:hypothetical protein NQ318_015536 [Aromia moschata]
MSLERQVRAKLAGKRDVEQDKQAQEWIETILGAKFLQVNSTKMSSATVLSSARSSTNLLLVPCPKSTHQADNSK